MATTSIAAPPQPGLEPMDLDPPPPAADEEDEDQEPLLVWYKLPILIPGRRDDGPKITAAANAADGVAAAAAVAAASAGADNAPASASAAVNSPPPKPVRMVVDWPAVVETIERIHYAPPQQKDMPSLCPRELRMFRFEALKYLVATRDSPKHRTLVVARLLGWECESPPRLLLDHRPDGTDNDGTPASSSSSWPMPEVDPDVPPLVDLTDGSYVPMSLPRDEADPDTWRAYQRGLEEAVDLMDAPAPRKRPSPPPSPSQPPVAAVPTATTETATAMAQATTKATTTSGTSCGQKSGATKRVSIEVPPPSRGGPDNSSASALATSQGGGAGDRTRTSTPAVAAKKPPPPAATTTTTPAAATKPPPAPPVAAGGGGGGSSTPHASASATATEERPGSVRKDQPSESSGGNREDDDDVPVDFGASNDVDDDEADEEEEEEVFVPKVYGPPILPHDPWEVAWRKLEFSCWNRRVRTHWHDDGSKTYSYVYTKADRCSTGPNAVLDRDYFESLDKVKDFARKHYGWIGPEAAAAAPASTTTATATATSKAAATATTARGATATTPTDATTRPQDPGAPRLDDDATGSSFARPAESESSPSDESSVSPSDKYTFKAVWERLKRKGWTAKRARDRLANWEYHPPPGLMPEGFFLKDNEAVVAFVKKRDAEKRKAKPKAPIVAVTAESPPYVPPDDNTKATSKRQKTGPKKPKTTFSEKLEKAAAGSMNSSQSRSNVAKAAATAAAKDSQPKKRDAASVPLKPRQVVAKKTKKKTQWWKSQPVPSDDVVWPILLQLGYYAEGEDAETKSYFLPKSLYESFPREDVLRFGSLQQLRLFLACYGTPPSPAVRIKKAEQEVLDRWIAFANVPVTHANSVKQINDASVVPKPDLKQLKALLFAHRFLSVDGTLYLPDSDTYERTVEKRRFGVHKFDENEHVEGYLRPYLRRAWAVFYPSRGSSSHRGRWDGSPDPKSKPSAKVTKLESEDYYATLSLRLWAATSSHDLPMFSEWPPREELDKFFAYKPTELLSEPPTPEKSEGSSDMDASFASDDVDDEAMVDDDEPLEIEDSGTSQSSEPDTRSTWDRVWHVLESKLGFHAGPNGEGYAHAKLPLVLATPNDLARYLCKHGIPEYDDKRKDISLLLRKELHKWVATAFVSPDLDGAPAPSEAKCLAILSKLGWQRCDEKHYAPGADDNRTHRVEGKDFFKGIDNLRLYLRSAERLGTFDESDEEECDLRKVTQDDLASIRLWASHVSLPLPTFGQTAEASGNPGRGGRSARRPLLDLNDLAEALPKRRSRPQKGSKRSSQDVPVASEMPSVDSKRPQAARGYRHSTSQTALLSASTKPTKASEGSWDVATSSAVDSVEHFTPPAKKSPTVHEAAAGSASGTQASIEAGAATRGSQPTSDPNQRMHEADSGKESASANLFVSKGWLTQNCDESEVEASDDDVGKVPADLPTPSEVLMDEADFGQESSSDKHVGGVQPMTRSQQHHKELKDFDVGDENQIESNNGQDDMDIELESSLPSSPRHLDSLNLFTQLDPGGDNDCDSDVEGFFSPQS